VITRVMGVVLVAVVVGMLEWRVVARNVGTRFNGYGAMGGVLARSSPAPMRYRVLVPWVVGWLPAGKGRAVAYQAAKVGLLAGALGVAEVHLGRMGMLGLAVIIAGTLEFDYWDQYAELVGLGLCLMGVPWAAAVGGVVWGLSRETAGLAPVVAGLAGGWPAGLAGLAGPAALGVVRLVQGRAVLYCERWTWRAYNVGDWKAAWERMDPGPLFSLGLCVGMVWAAVTGGHLLEGALGATRWVGLVWVVMGWTMGRGRESRLFLPCALWILGR